MNDLIAGLKNIATQNSNGFTVLLSDLTPVTKGWIVAMKETQNSFGDEGLERVLKIALKTSKVIGGWKQGRKWYWDASRIFDTEKDATKAGIENEQIAIYNIETNFLKFI